MNNAVEHYIMNCKKEHQATVFAVRDVILNAGPVIEEFKWKCPFYSYKGFLCYLNVYQNKIVTLGFVKGFQLSNEQNILEAQDRKQIRHISYNNLEDFYKKETATREILQEAMLLNEKIKSEKNN